MQSLFVKAQVVYATGRTKILQEALAGSFRTCWVFEHPYGRVFVVQAIKELTGVFTDHQLLKLFIDLFTDVSTFAHIETTGGITL